MAPRWCRDGAEIAPNRGRESIPPQVLATLATINVFVLSTGGISREWYGTGGILLTNGMLVDFGTITIIMQAKSRPS